MVIECIGLPGSGKTFLIRELQRELENRGIPVENVSEMRMNRVSYKAYAKILRAGLIPDRETGRLRARLRAVLADEKPLTSRFGIYEDEDYTVRSAAAFAQVYRKMMKSPKVYLFDEGLIHALVKLCADFGISDRNFLAMAKEAESGLTGARLIIYNTIPVEDCVRSIRKRDRHICAFDELDSGRLEDILREYVRLNRCCAEHFDVLEVSRAEESRAKTERIMERISSVTGTPGRP